MLKKSQIAQARKHCANWNNGDCLGCLIRRNGNQIILRMSRKIGGKPCSVDKGCEYFETIVVPGIKE